MANRQRPQKAGRLHMKYAATAIHRLSMLLMLLDFAMLRSGNAARCIHFNLCHYGELDALEVYLEHCKLPIKSCCCDPIIAFIISWLNYASTYAKSLVLKLWNRKH